MGRKWVVFPSWGLKSLILLGLFGLAWLSSGEPSREPIECGWLVASPAS